METKDKSSRSASKTDLNESTLPLLDDEGDGDRDTSGGKEKLELKERSSTSSVGGGEEKDDSKTEKMEEEGGSNDVQGADEDKTKGPKKKKVKKEHRRSPSCVQTMTVGLNFLDRDEKKVNDHINLQFEDILAEPDGSHSFDGVWRGAYVAFGGTRIWLYRVLAALLALPCALCWGVNFALLSFFHIWAITPVLRIFELLLFFVKRIWSSIIHTICDPVFESLGLIFVNMRLHQRREDVVVA